jgi:hypothetical protein
MHVWAACAAPLSPAVLICTNWRLCPRAAPHCRSSVTDAGTCRRSCILLNGQPTQPYNQPTRLILPLRAALTASITTAALPPASPAAAASATTVEVATACERGASALSQPGSGARHKNDILHLQEPGTTALLHIGLYQ